MSGSNKHITLTPVAKSVPFDNSTNSFSSTDTQAAIEEAKTVAALSGSALNFGYQGNANTGRYLEVVSNNPTSGTPFIVAGNLTVTRFSVSVDSSTTGTVTLYKNGVALDSISLTSQKKNTKLNLNYSLLDMDELSAKVTSGIFSRINFTVWL